MNKENISYVKGAFNLPIQTVTYVPSTKDFSKKISNEEFQIRIKETKTFLSKLFGGFTSVKAIGGYLLKDKTIEENVAMVTAYAEEEVFKKKKQQWLDWCGKKKKEWRQDSIGIVIENDLMYI